MIVVDSSAVLAILLREQSASAVFKAIEQGDALLAPALLPYEVMNGLRSAERLKRIDADTASKARTRMAAFPWSYDVHGSESALRDVTRISVAHGLTAYDATYLELAARQGCPLVTLDAGLRKAARAEHVQVLPRTAA
jgi:predicted nucleic acid-binding protein